MPLPHGAFPAAALRAAALGAGALLLSVLGYRLAGSAEIAADGRWDTPFFTGFSPFTPRPQPGRPRRAPGAEQLPFIRGFRVSSPEARIALRGLLPRTLLHVALAIGSALPSAQVLVVTANDVPVHRQLVGAVYRPAAFDASTDASGRLELALSAEERPGRAAYRVGAVELQWSPRWPGASVLASLAALVALMLAIGAVFRAPSAGTLLLTVALAAATGALLWRWPVLVADRLPSVLVAMGATLAVSVIAVRALRMEALAAAFVAASCLLRLAFVLHPAFPSIDALFHIAGSWLSLASLVAILAPVNAVTASLLATLALLAHPGAAATLAALLASWLAWSLARRRMSVTLAARIATCLAAGVLLAWLVYYRAAAELTVRTLTSIHTEPGNVRVRWVHLGKILQDAVLKFGATPLFFVGSGLRRAPDVLKGLLQAWLITAGLLALLAVLTPIAFRFEYFAVPAVALAAGQGLAPLLRSPRRSRAAAVWLVPLALQAGLAVVLFAGGFDPISVIIPADRWPLFGVRR
ncbi:MAG TPA: hypothetical protein VEQ84_15395 [Vicinamibacteria bacterium]|nr:hypothetical protein [Vicinamibacteria bacterium]